MQSESTCSGKSTISAAQQTEGMEAEVESGRGFFPPLYIQRMAKIASVLSRHSISRVSRSTLYTKILVLRSDSLHYTKLRQVLDCGCGEGRLLDYLRNDDSGGIKELAGIDVDPLVLDKAARVCSPRVADYILPRAHPLSIALYKGMFTNSLIGTDAE